MEAETLIHLDPAKILADDNVRYGGAPPRSAIESMKASIVDRGQVMVPVEVEALPKAQDGYKYRLTTGFTRVFAVLELNKEGAGLTVPAIVRPSVDATDRLKRQLTENIERRNQSPMDQASAIKKLLDAGVSRLTIREMFKRPGGKKGTQLQPASNAWLNMTVSFLELPKDIRDKIHSGAVGVAAAYELTKVAPEKRADVLKRAEEEREKALEREAKEEEKYLDAERKLDDATKKEEETITALDHAKVEVELAEKAAEAKLAASADAYKASQMAPKDEKKRAVESFKAAEKDAKAAEAAVAQAKKEYEKLTASKKSVEEKAAKLRAHLEQTRKSAAGKPKAKAVGPTDVKKAAQAEGAGGHVALNASQMRETVNSLALPGTYAKVQLIGAAFKECFDGISTPGQLLKKLANITGELKAKK